ncbi:MAG TPA: YkgJ family cysteine cluster protein [Bacillota bacterium]|nr:YkgJ family cysteine cluster protein [Bacillota bacterium]
MKEVTVQEGEFYSPIQCRNCGGKCCAIYLPDYEGGTYPAEQVYLEHWAEQFHQAKENYGVEPLFDPLKIHKHRDEYLLRELKERGIDADFCQYLDSKTGCLIPWENRPKQCKTYKCPEWEGEV